MNTILYGNLSAEIVSDAGVRVQRLTLRRALPDLLQSRQPLPPVKPTMFGREREVADALAAVQARRPAEFVAACGFGKTTLLEHVAATAAERGLDPTCIYLRADRDSVGDLLQQLVDRLYISEPRVKLTPQQCAQLLGQVNAVVAVDDLNAGPGEVGYLLDVLSSCRLVLGSARPVLGHRGLSYKLGGLSEGAALALLADELERPLTTEERAAAGRLVRSVKCQPLHVKQCAALVREGRHSFRSLARQAALDPEALDRLSINALAHYERRALAVLALAAGVLLPSSLVETIGQLAEIGEWLDSLRGRGLAEQRDDRFGLPVCKAESYRHLLFKDLHLATAARELTTWLAAADPATPDAQSAAAAAVAILESAAERGDWPVVVRLARAAEQAMFLAGRWEAWHHLLSRGLEAARASAGRAAEAFFLHQQGTLAFFRDQLPEAHGLLQQALTLREQIGDQSGADVTRHNLRLLDPPAMKPPPRRRVPRRVMVTAASALATAALAAGTTAIASALGRSQSAGPAASVSAASATPSSRAVNATSSASPSSQPSGSAAPLFSQTISFTSTPPSAPVPGGTYAVTASGGGSGNPVTLTIDPSSSTICTIAGATVTFSNAGTCVIDANQAGSATYQPAPQARQTVQVGAKLIPQTISFTSTPPDPGVQGNTYTVTASGGGSGNPVTFSIDPSSSTICAVAGSTVTFYSNGNCVIDANQAGSSKYLPAPQAQQTVMVVLQMQ